MPPSTSRTDPVQKDGVAARRRRRPTPATSPPVPILPAGGRSQLVRVSRPRPGRRRASPSPAPCRPGRPHWRGCRAARFHASIWTSMFRHRLRHGVGADRHLGPDPGVGRDRRRSTHRRTPGARARTRAHSGRARRRSPPGPRPSRRPRSRTAALRAGRPRSRRARRARRGSRPPRRPSSRCSAASRASATDEVAPVSAPTASPRVRPAR